MARNSRIMALITALVLAMLVPMGALAAYSEPGTFPITTEPKEISVMTVLDDLDAESNYMTGWYEEKTGVHVNWVQANRDVFMEKMNLALASGDDLDFITAQNMGETAVNTTQLQKYIDQGLIIGIKDLMNNYAPNMKAALDSVDGWRAAITNADGDIYTVPWFDECQHCNYYGKMWVNTKWLENLGMEIPTTIEEFKAMLIAFRDNDPNGNGVKDEIPLVGAAKDGFFGKLTPYLMSAFVYDDGEDRLMINDEKKVVAGYTNPKYQEGLKYLNDLYEEGLIYPDSFTMTFNDMGALNAQQYEANIGAFAWCVHMWTPDGREAEDPRKWLEYTPVTPLVGPDGLQITRVSYFNSMGLDWLTSFIPATCEDPELVIRWLDLLYTEEGQIMSTRGPKGIAWDEPDEGATGVNGGPAAYKTLTIGEDSPYYGIDMIWGNTFPEFNSAAMREGNQQPDMFTPNGDGLEAFLYYYTATNYEPYGIPFENVVPPLYYGDDVISDMARLRTDINTYVEECTAKFITGELDVESDWDSFQEQLKAIGIDQYLSIIQAAYEASPYYTAE